MNNKLKVIFTLSLALNLLLVGFLAGKGCFFGCKMGPHGERGGGGFDREALINVLPHEKRAQAIEVFDKIRKSHHDGFAKNKAVFSEVEKIVVAPEFDKEKFLKSLNNMREEMLAGKGETDKMVADFLVSLTVEERKALSEEFKKSRKGFHGKKGGKHEGPKKVEGVKVGDEERAEGGL